MACKILVSFYGNNVIQTFLLLLPKQRDTSSNLTKTIKVLVVCYYDFTLDEVGHIRVVVYTSCNESGTCHCMSPSRNEHDIKLLVIEILSSLFNIPLNDWDCPECIDVLESEVLNDLLIPLVSFVHKLIPESIGVVQTWFILKFNISLSLLATCDI